jgi:hypothetical protein
MAALADIFRGAAPYTQAHYTIGTQTFATVVSMPPGEQDGAGLADQSRYWLRLYGDYGTKWTGNTPMSGTELAATLAGLTPPIPTERGWTEGAAPAPVRVVANE